MFSLQEARRQSVHDDADGHLIYKIGDVINERCKPKLNRYLSIFVYYLMWRI